MAAERTRRLTQLMAETNALFTKDPMFGDRNASTVAQERVGGSWVVVGGRGGFRSGRTVDQVGRLPDSGAVTGWTRAEVGYLPAESGSQGAVARLEWAPSSVWRSESGS